MIYLGYLMLIVIINKPEISQFGDDRTNLAESRVVHLISFDDVMTISRNWIIILWEMTTNSMDMMI